MTFEKVERVTPLDLIQFPPRGSGKRVYHVVSVRFRRIGINLFYSFIR